MVLLISLYDVVFLRCTLRRVPTVFGRERPERDDLMSQSVVFGTDRVHVSPDLAVWMFAFLGSYPRFTNSLLTSSHDLKSYTTGSPGKRTDGRVHATIQTAGFRMRNEGHRTDSASAQCTDFTLKGRTQPFADHICGKRVVAPYSIQLLAAS